MTDLKPSLPYGGAETGNVDFTITLELCGPQDLDKTELARWIERTLHESILEAVNEVDSFDVVDIQQGYSGKDPFGY